MAASTMAGIIIRENERILNTHTQQEKWKPTRIDITLYLFLGICFIGQITLCLLFYNGSNLDSFLYIGWSIIVLAFFVVGGMARIAFTRQGKSLEKGKWLKTTVVVDKGIYALVRHPMYLSFMMYPVALMFISQHWLSLILGLPFIIYLYFGMRSEEKNNIDKFGDSYRKYMEKVPRMNILLGIFRLWRRSI